MNAAAYDYKLLLERFLNGEIPPKEFQLTYLDKFKNESRTFPEPLFELLDGMFGDVDAFCVDPDILAELQVDVPGFYLDEQTFRNRLAEAYERLLKLLDESAKTQDDEH